MTDPMYRDLCLPLFRICAGPYNQTELGLSSESKGSYILQGKSRPINLMVFYHINAERIPESCMLIACCKDDWHSSGGRDYFLKFRFLK